MDEGSNLGRRDFCFLKIRMEERKMEERSMEESKGGLFINDS